MCRQTLVSAAEMIKKRSPPTTLLDGQLFLVRHLLILKEIVHNLSLTNKETDPNDNLTGVTGKGKLNSACSSLTRLSETFTSMLNKTSLLLPDRFLSTLGVARAEDIKETKYVRELYHTSCASTTDTTLRASTTTCDAHARTSSRCAQTLSATLSGAG